METKTKTDELARCVELLRTITRSTSMLSEANARRCVLVPAELIGRAEGALRMLDLIEGGAS